MAIGYCTGQDRQRKFLLSQNILLDGDLLESLAPKIQCSSLELTHTFILGTHTGTERYKLTMWPQGGKNQKYLGNTMMISKEWILGHCGSGSRREGSGGQVKITWGRQRHLGGTRVGACDCDGHPDLRSCPSQGGCTKEHGSLGASYLTERS